MYQYGNVAVQYQKERQRRPQPKRVQKPPVQQPKPHVQRKSSISAGEKVLYILVVIGMVIVASLLLSRSATISQLNYEVQIMEKELSTLQDQNVNLQLMVSEKSSADAIIKKAEEFGMTKSESTVKIMTANTKEKSSNE